MCMRSSGRSKIRPRGPQLNVQAGLLTNQLRVLNLAITYICIGNAKKERH